MAKARYWVDALKEFGRDYIYENTGLKILALLITAVLWLSVASRPASDLTLNNVPIEFKLPELPELIVSKWDTMVARVTLRGPRDVLDALSPNDLALVADMSSVEPGVRVIPLQLDRTRLPSSLEARAIEPDRVRVNIERVVENEVPVKPRFEGEPPTGYELHYEVKPERVRVKGVASQVRSLTEASTETISLTGKTGHFTEEVAVDIGVPNVSVENDTVTLSITVQESRSERTFDRVPVTLAGGSAPAALRPRFVKVTVEGPRSLIESLTPDDLIVSVSTREQRGSFDVAPAVTFSRDPDKLIVKKIEPSLIRVLLR